jgi:hypothetical protein
MAELEEDAADPVDIDLAMRPTTTHLLNRRRPRRKSPSYLVIFAVQTCYVSSESWSIFMHALQTLVSSNLAEM